MISLDYYMQNMLNLFTKQQEFQKIIPLFPSGKGVLDLGVQEDLWPFIAAYLASACPMPLLVITSTIDRAKELMQELSPVTSRKIYGWPPLGSAPYYENRSSNLMHISQRLQALKALQKKSKPVLVSGISACLNRMDQRKAQAFKPGLFAVGGHYSREDMSKKLIEAGYERVNMVFDKGEFSVKGSVVDIYGMASSHIIRLDFFGDALEGIYKISPVSRNIQGRLKKAAVYPCINPWQRGKGPQITLQQHIKQTAGSLCLVLCDPLEIQIKLGSDRDILAKILQKDLEKTVFDHMQDAHRCLMAEQDLEKGADLLFRLKSPDAQDVEKLGLGGQKKSFGRPKTLLSNIRKDFSEHRKVTMAISGQKRMGAIEQILSDGGISFGRNVQGQHHVVNLTHNRLMRGFVSEKHSVYGELDIYAFFEKKPQKGALTSLKEIEDFKPGEYLVHKTHGIGRYLDIVSRKTGGDKKEYFLIEYAKGDKLYVPTWQADRITRYIGAENPTITTLHSKQWDSMKKRVRQSVQKLAINLSRLYAQREAAEGISFPQESPWQREMADLFPFTETEDQTRAIKKVKQAMARPKPMDLLLCGDVGFGKTEVAIRAAFSAIETGKQVMMLVPTTILADQHYRTFCARYKDYPVILEVLSRFRKKKSASQIISRFNEGKIDMIIGTHRILQKDVKPAHLGLIIVDEEQRFGVASKEKIKLLKKNADVLTLTATPIPRTLYMALTGIRDMATIQTYPEGRNPIETFVGKRDREVIRQAIEREMARGGQVYYVFNHVGAIESKLQSLQSIVPQARIALTHGRMNGSTIEQTMADFVNRKYDILLTTTIIESGMDISNVNTLIVEHAHRFGLSQLYQLRGRVGRSTERAYSYFFYPERKTLGINALRRLKALAEHTDLGSGYSIALRDMEIRGAGEILGPRQSGHMESVGFDMYCQIMQEEVAKIKGQPVTQDINIQIEVPVSAYIPKSFMPGQNERISAYRSLGKTKSIPEVERIRAGLAARYGSFPQTVENLIKIAKIKILMQKASIASLAYARGNLVLKKMNLNRDQKQAIDRLGHNIVYDRKSGQLVMDTQGQNVDLDLTYAVLDVLIKKSDSKEKR